MFSDHQGVSIHQLIESQALRTPDAVAVVFQDQQLTYGELNQKANQLAHYLQTLGVKPEVLVGICVERSLDMMIALLGTLKAGGAYVPLDPAYPSDRLAFMLEDSQLSVLLTQQDLLEILPECKATVVCLDTGWEAIALSSCENPISQVVPENLAYIIYTSGSTGKPKGVQIIHRSLANLLISMQREPGLTAEDTVLAITTFSFDLSVPDLYLPLIVGAKLRLIERKVASDATQLAKVLSEPGVTFVQATPASWRLVLAADWKGNQNLKVLCGGDAVPRSLANQLLGKVDSLWHMYGPTETTVWSMLHKVELEENIIPLGRPIANTQIYLVEELVRRQDDILTLVPVGKPGEVYIGGDGVARGYRNRPELTAQKFIPDPFSQMPGARLYRTGDFARYRSDGNIEFIGRVDHQIKIRGHRVELGDIEVVLNQHPSVRDAVVIAKEDNSGSNRLVGYVVPEDDLRSSSNSTDQLQQWQDIWSATYSQSSTDSDVTFNSSGWNDSFTGLPMPTEQVSEWVNATVERVLDLKPQKLLEIGCGMGLLLYRIAPSCTEYVGTDISAEAIQNIEQIIGQDRQKWSHVTVAQKAAHELESFESRAFDTVVINSVIQYFPQVEYLVEVLEKAISLVKPGGRIFVGDVRNLNLLEIFHTGIQLNQSPDSLSGEQIRQGISGLLTKERELVIRPDFFNALKHHIPRISHVQNQLKRGSSEDELTRYRYDVVLHVETEVLEMDEPLTLDWKLEDLSISKIYHFLQQNQPSALRVNSIPNLRIFSEIRMAKCLTASDCPETVGELRQHLQKMDENAIHPEEFWSLGQKLSYGVHINWSHDAAGHFDVTLFQQSMVQQGSLVSFSTPSQESVTWDNYSNVPLQSSTQGQLVPQLRSFLKERLPDYMVPSTFMIMEKFPLTPNGKTDRRSLPEPRKDRPALTEEYIAPFTSLEKQLAELWSQVLEIEQIGVQDNFFDLGGHSLLATQLLALIEESIEIELPLFYLLREPTIVGLVKAIDTVRNLGITPLLEENIEVDLQAEIVLDPSIQPENSFTGTVDNPSHIFLTGATGFLGAFLLQELLQQTQAEIYCLVRASDMAEGRQKIEANLQRYMLWKGELNPRVIPVLGDLSQPSLGLSQEKFRALASTLDLIYHCGAFVNLVYPYSALRAANVMGTQSILRLASHEKITPVHFISTIDVFQSPSYFKLQVIREDGNLEHGQELSKGYAQTKWVAEKLITAAQSRGIPISIYRPGMLTGHSQFGVSQTNDLMCRIIKGMIQMGAAPDLDHWVNMIPIDYASKAIIHLSRQPESLGKAFHIVNPCAIPWNFLLDSICSFGYPLQILSHEQWQSELLKLNNTQDNALFAMKSLFTEKGKDQMTYLEAFLLTAKAFDSQNTQKGLEGSKVACPVVDTALIHRYLAYFNSSNFLATPERFAEDANSSIPREFLWNHSAGAEYPVQSLLAKD
jgi:amino acid adenylation domain-containing protein/thioester reductase-like protein